MPRFFHVHSELFCRTSKGFTSLSQLNSGATPIRRILAAETATGTVTRPPVQVRLCFSKLPYRDSGDQGSVGSQDPAGKRGVVGTGGSPGKIGKSDQTLTTILDGLETQRPEGSKQRG